MIALSLVRTYPAFLQRSPTSASSPWGLIVREKLTWPPHETHSIQRPPLSSSLSRGISDEAMIGMFVAPMRVSS